MTIFMESYIRDVKIRDVLVDVSNFREKVSKICLGQDFQQLHSKSLRPTLGSPFQVDRKALPVPTICVQAEPT